jgi:hypothetical protein
VILVQGQPVIIGTNLTEAVPSSVLLNKGAGLAAAVNPPTGNSFYGQLALTAGDVGTLGLLDVIFYNGASDAIGSWHGVVLPAYPSTGDPLASLIPGAYGAGTAGKVIGDNLDQPISSRLATIGYTAPDNTGIASAANIATNIDAGLTAGSYFIQLTAGDFDALVAAIWQTANQIDGQYSYQEAVRLMLAALAGLVSISGNVVTIRDTADTKNRIVATTDAAGQRLTVALNAT